MTGLRSMILALAGFAVWVGGEQSAQAQIYGWYGGHHSGFYVGSGYAPGAFGSYYASPYRVYAPAYGYNAYGYGVSPYAYSTFVAPNPLYGTTTTIIRGGPSGGVVQYSNNGNGYTYVPDSGYPTVIQQQPTLGLSRTIVQPSPPPVVREIPPKQGTSYGLLNSLQSNPNPIQSNPSVVRNAGMIKLVCPKNAGGPLQYSLNGHAYTIQPGFSQSFRDDRAWTVEFKRGGDGSETVRYPLKAGTYTFAIGANGWDIQEGVANPVSDIPPAPLPTDPGAADPTSNLPPSPLPPP